MRVSTTPAASPASLTSTPIKRSRSLKSGEAGLSVRKSVPASSSRNVKYTPSWAIWAWATLPCSRSAANSVYAMGVEGVSQKAHTSADTATTRHTSAVAVRLSGLNAGLFFPPAITAAPLLGPCSNRCRASARRRSTRIQRAMIPQRPGHLRPARKERARRSVPAQASLGTCGPTPARASCACRPSSAQVPWAPAATAPRRATPARRPHSFGFSLPYLRGFPRRAAHAYTSVICGPRARIATKERFVSHDPAAASLSH